MTQTITGNAKKHAIDAINARRSWLYSNDRSRYDSCLLGLTVGIRLITFHTVQGLTTVEALEDWRDLFKRKLLGLQVLRPDDYQLKTLGLIEAKSAVRDLLERTIAKARGITLQQYYHEEGLTIEPPEERTE